MRMNALWIAALGLCVITGAATAKSKSAMRHAKAPMVMMTANVAQIEEPSEKTRWQANLDMWNVARNAHGALRAADIAAMQPAFATMKANVATITQKDEKQRWTANVRLWDLVLAHPGDMMPASSLAKMKKLLPRARVGNVAEEPADEIARWNANHAMWKTTIVRISEMAARM